MFCVPCNGLVVEPGNRQREDESTLSAIDGEEEYESVFEDSDDEAIKVSFLKKPVQPLVRYKLVLTT